MNTIKIISFMFSLFFCSLQQMAQEIDVKDSLAIKNKTKPNIILIMADDIGAEAFGCYGGESHATPYIDSLAQEGIRFDYAYAQPVCSPARTQVLTGRYPYRSNVTHNKGGGSMINVMYEFRNDPLGLDANGHSTILTFANLLKTQGYKTAVAGKWGLSQYAYNPLHENKMGFDNYCSWLRVHHDTFTRKYWHPSYVKDQKVYEDVKGVYGPDVYSQYLIDFIKKNKDDPFLVYYPMTLVHFWNEDPEMPPEKEGKPLWSKKKKYPQSPKTPASTSYSGKEFYKSMAYMDEIVGRIIKTVDELGLSHNTLIIFTSDNGSIRHQTTKYNGEYVTGAKGKVNDAGCRVPFVARWKGKIKPGQYSDEIVDLADIFPSFAELASASIPKNHNLDGISFIPTLFGTSRKSKTHTFLQFKNALGVRTKEWFLSSEGFFDMRKGHYKPRLVDLSNANLIENKSYKQLQSYLNLYKLEALEAYRILGDFYPIKDTP